MRPVELSGGFTDEARRKRLPLTKSALVLQECKRSLQSILSLLILHRRTLDVGPRMFL